MGGIDVGIRGEEGIMEEKAKNKEFLYVIWVAFGLAILLIILIRPLIVHENAYRKIEGEITNLFATGRGYRLALNTSEIIFATSRCRYNVLREKEVVGKEAVIWYSIMRASRGNPRRQYFIQKVIVDDEIVIPFHRGIVGFIFVGIVGSFFVACIIYIIRYLRQQ